ncbi:MAG: hypothetical protein MZV70_75580 [Desulfobacterales bacterium]|nr:hypothetical protein [Desulfobacterales bacterium]
MKILFWEAETGRSIREVLKSDEARARPGNSSSSWARRAGFPARRRKRPGRPAFSRLSLGRLVPAGGNGGPCHSGHFTV